MLEIYLYKKLLEISGDCCVTVRHALYLHSGPNHILVYSLKLKIEVSLYIAVGNRFHIFGLRFVRLLLPNLMYDTCINLLNAKVAII